MYHDVVGALTQGSVGETVGAAGTAASSAALTNPTPVAGTSSAPSTATFTFGAATDTVSGTLAVAGGSLGAITTTFVSGTSIAQAADQLNVANSGTQLVVTGTNTAGNAGTLTLTGTSLTDTTPATQGTSGAGTDFTAAGVSTLSASTAQTVLTTVTSAIAGVAYQRGVIGADINELSAASNVASAESENLTSAQSSIESTNYGQATSNLAKFQVLSQTGISALAQANSVQQEILKLLQ